MNNKTPNPSLLSAVIWGTEDQRANIVTKTMLPLLLLLRERQGFGSYKPGTMAKAKYI